MSGPPAPSQPPPAGFSVALDSQVRWLDATTLIGGVPRRRVTLSAAGARALTAVRAGESSSVAAAHMARRLLDAGVLHPRPAPDPGPLDVTVVIPVRDRTDLLDRTLGSITEAVRVVVVDDGSEDPAAVQQIATAHGAEVLRRYLAGGPACARNAGAAVVDSTFTAFLDSDCEVPSGWLSQLIGHFADPAVGAVAPRIRPATVRVETVLSRYLQLRSPLDMGPAPGPVGPSRRVRYLPAAALVLRTASLGQGFDEGLRYGEDVDLVWRLRNAGWQIRYDPSVVVAHREPSRLWCVLRRRFSYGTSAAPLAARHGRELAPAIVSREVVVAGVALLVGRPRLAGMVAAVTVIGRVRRMCGAGLPRDVALSWSCDGLAAELTGAARFLAGPGLPVMLGVLLRKPATGSLILLVPAVSDWRRRPHRVAAWSFVRLAVLDEAAYGAGVVIGSLKSRSMTALQPRITSPTATRLRHRAPASFTLTIVSKAVKVRHSCTRRGPAHPEPAGEPKQALDPELPAAGAGSSVDGRPGG